MTIVLLFFFGIDYTARNQKDHTQNEWNRRVYRIEGACTLGSNSTDARAGKIQISKSIQTIWWLQLLVQTFVKFSSSNKLNNSSIYPMDATINI